jgi:hypothetical protein
VVSAASDLLLGVVAGLLTSAVLASVTLVLRERARRSDAGWFGAKRGDAWVAALSRHWAGHDAAAFEEIATVAELARLADNLGCSITVLPNDQVDVVGESTEFTIGGPATNRRTAAYVRAWLPDVSYFSHAEGPSDLLDFDIQGTVYRQKPGVEYALLARLTPRRDARPVFIIAGQWARTNVAAARYLRQNHRALRRRFDRTPFGLVLANRDADTFGSSMVDEVQETRVEARDKP